MMSLLGLLPSPPAVVSGGPVQFEGKDLLRVSDAEMRAVRGARVGFVVPGPMTSLNPVFTVGYQITEPCGGIWG
jgi:peptide/nickel transport system ATP-binding protein/oligopeptide transport system ATP-binding protein